MHLHHAQCIVHNHVAEYLAKPVIPIVENRIAD